MATSFSFDIEGDAQVQRFLSRTTKKAQNLRPFLEDAAGFMRETVAAQFDTEGGRAGGWAPLSERYAADKVRRFGGGSILVASGRLRASVTQPGGENIAEIEGQGMRFGTSVPYGRYHQRGTSRMPQRRFLDLIEEDRRAIMKMLQRYLFTDR